jgi:hypothetical protein
VQARRALAGVTALVSVALLCACSSPPEPEPDARHITADEFEGLVLADDLAIGATIDTTFNLEPLALKAPAIQSFWDESDGDPVECLDSYFASYILRSSEVGDPNDDEFGDVAGYYPGENGAINVSGRSFESEDAAVAFLESVQPSAAACTTAGGYELYQGDGVVGWGVTAVTTGEPRGFSVPDAVTAVEQEEVVTEGFALRYRVILLQFDNAIVAVTAQLHSTSTFTFDQVDELAGLVAGRLAELD